jgi:TetR/AcrR family transcriptional repressor of bet genes
MTNQGRPMGGTSNTGSRRAQITGALVRVMARRGYDGASVAGVARAARLAPGLVHYYFRNKREILMAALETIVARHDAGLETRLAAVAGDPVSGVGAFIDFHLGLGADSDPEALSCWIQLSGEALRDPGVRSAFARAMESTADRLSAILREGVGKRVFRCEDVPAAAGALVAAVQGYFVLAATARATIPKGSAARSTKRMAEGILRPLRPLADAGVRP